MDTNNIKTRNDFVDFLDYICTDFNSNTKDWANRNLKDFLEAMHSYVQDIDGYYLNTKQNDDANQPSWKRFADILLGAKVDE